MSSRDVIRALTLDFDVPPNTSANHESPTESPSASPSSSAHPETEALLLRQDSQVSTLQDPESGEPMCRNPSGNHTTMSALEIAIAGEALKFLASPIVQGVLHDIWKGNIVLWGDIDVNATTARKKATIYKWGRTMWVGYARLRVPRYRFAFQVLNFAILLALFLATLRQTDQDHISVQEIFLDIWFLGFAYAELGIIPTIFTLLFIGQIRDSNLSMYSQDPWSFFDIAMVLIFGEIFQSRD
jgi:hypothetical protein